MQPTPNPFLKLREEAAKLLNAAVDNLGFDITVSPDDLKPTRNLKFGWLCYEHALRLARTLAPPQTPQEFAEKLVSHMPESNVFLKIEAVRGYVNFYPNLNVVNHLVISSVETLGDVYGFEDLSDGRVICVEHCSANPCGPIHVGTLRNAVLGDTLARMLRHAGYRVLTRFYVEDTGRQTAIAAYGWQFVADLIKRDPRPDEKIGIVYTVVNTVIELEELRRKAATTSDPDQLSLINHEIHRRVGIIHNQMERDEALVKAVLENLSGRPVVDEIAQLNLRYEQGDENAVRLIRSMVDLVVQEFQKTLEALNISYDRWDYQSEIVWSGLVNQILSRLKQTPFVREEGGALIFDAERAAVTLGLKERLRFHFDEEIPDLTLTRSDGTALYVTKDAAYTLYKRRDSDLLINVIAQEQSLAQRQLKLLLAAIGERDAVNYLVHFSYGPVVGLSRRRGRYMTAREALEALQERCIVLLRERGELSESEINKVSRLVAVGALRYSMVSIEPDRPVQFDPKRMTDLEANSAPFVQYAYVRARGILRRAAEAGVSPNGDPSLLKESVEERLLFMIARFPESFRYAVRTLRPHVICEHLYQLARTFHRYYEAVPVIKADPDTARARARLVRCVAQVLKNGLDLLGIPVLERM
ncbi:arginine--tRNA ligase [archaeon]|nr:arginine--tRNA ligase [archaeon]